MLKRDKGQTRQSRRYVNKVSNTSLFFFYSATIPLRFGIILLASTHHPTRRVDKQKKSSAIICGLCDLGISLEKTTAEANKEKNTCHNAMLNYAHN